MLELKYGYLVRLADKTLHFVVFDRDWGDFAREHFRLLLEDAMRQTGKIDKDRISIRYFWPYGQIRPKNPAPRAPTNFCREAESFATGEQRRPLQ
jgi:hypothetical protein